MKAKRIKVSQEFDRVLREQHDKFNKEIAVPFLKKRISLIGFSALVAKKVLKNMELGAPPSEVLLRRKRGGFVLDEDVEI